MWSTAFPFGMFLQLTAPSFLPPVSYYSFHCQWDLVTARTLRISQSLSEIKCLPHLTFCPENSLLWLSRVGLSQELHKAYTVHAQHLHLSRFPKLFLIYFYSFNYCLFTDDSQSYLQSQPAPWSSYLWIQLPVQNSTWMSYRHRKGNMLKTELVIFSLSWYLLSSSLSPLLSWLFNQSCKLGIPFDSSHSFIPQIKPTD